MGIFDLPANNNRNLSEASVETRKFSLLSSSGSRRAEASLESLQWMSALDLPADTLTLQWALQRLELLANKASICGVGWKLKHFKSTSCTGSVLYFLVYFSHPVLCFNLHFIYIHIEFVVCHMLPEVVMGYRLDWSLPVWRQLGTLSFMFLDDADKDHSPPHPLKQKGTVRWNQGVYVVQHSIIVWFMQAASEYSSNNMLHQQVIAPL